MNLFITAMFSMLALLSAENAEGSIKISLDYNYSSLTDNGANLALGDDITTATDDSGIGKTAAGLGVRIGIEKSFFGIRGKYLLEQKVVEKTGSIIDSGSVFATSSTNLSWSGYGADVYFILFEKSVIRPTLGAGYLMSKFKLKQDFVEVGNSGFTGEGIVAEADTGSVYFYAGFDFTLSKFLGIGIQVTRYSLSIDEFILTQSFKATGFASRLESGTSAKKLNSNGSDYEGKYIADLSRTEIVISLNMLF